MEFEKIYSNLWNDNVFSVLMIDHSFEYPIPKCHFHEYLVGTWFKHTYVSNSWLCENIVSYVRTYVEHGKYVGKEVFLSFGALGRLNVSQKIH